MAGPRYTLTADYQQKVCGMVRDGVRPATASEAAGIPRQVMARWVRAGRSARALPRYKGFAAALMRARGRAVVEHQKKTFQFHPQEWGRDQRDRRKARRAQNPEGGMPKGENVHGVVNIFEMIAVAKAALAELP